MINQWIQIVKCQYQCYLIILIWIVYIIIVYVINQYHMRIVSNKNNNLNIYSRIVLKINQIVYYLKIKIR